MKIFNKRTCKVCDAICCRYITIPLKTPEIIEDFENIKWYISHENTEVNIEEDGAWYIKLKTPCEHLSKNNLCSIYKNRPEICKEHTTKSCEKYNEENFILTFKSVEEVNKYIETILKKGRHQTI
ncbi:MAG: YkgJ family cysteine cluster protein [Nanoarchaeota archaeon]|jgi:Fe-S-cluster containining protein|nr:YkgJ family cysteine cluster protein [Nanoarchaeota archaeon]